MKATRWGLGCLAVFPCLVSLGFHLQGPIPQTAAPASKRPALAFDQYAVNKGPVQPMSFARAHFRFTNQSDRNVTITELKPSCGCLNPRLEKKEYAPGESGQFFVQVATAGEQPGPRHYTITVNYLDPKPQSEVLTFRLELPPKQVYLTPRAVLVYQFGEEITTKEIVVTDNRSKPIAITHVECGADFLSAKVMESATDDAGVTQSKILLTVHPVPKGSYSSRVKIHTDDPKFPVLTVPVQVHRQEPMIGLRPKKRE